MKKFKTLTSQVVPIARKDIDTDIIIPAQFLTAVKRRGFGRALFSRFRNNPDFKYFKKFRKAKILVALENFGCGSSREHAVWALQDYGFQVIIAPSFANIFQNNALKNGLLPIKLFKKTIEKIIKNASSQKKYEITVDLQNLKITFPDNSTKKFQIDPFRKECILNGMNDMDYLLSKLKEIKKFDKQRASKLFL